MHLESGNLSELDTEDTGWFIGYSDWTRSAELNLRHMPFNVTSKGLCVKWYSHVPGYPNGELKPISTGRTISILVDNTGEFKIEFSNSPQFEQELTKSVILKSLGDYVIWGEKLFHRAYCLAPSTILTVRWEPEDTEN